ncbi:MAG: hypothetical protein GQ582_12585 [Methyloprofundus sp.]|nr:hypothetical protein [Methyloprofundus sp.]
MMKTQLLKGITVLSVLLSTQVKAIGVDAALVSAAAGVQALTSIGRFDVTITKGEGVAISGISAAGGIAITNKKRKGSMDICTYATTARYQIDINSLNTADDRFYLTSISGDQIPFKVKWEDGKNKWDFDKNSRAPKSGRTSGISRADPTCGGGTNTKVTVSIGRKDFNRVPVGHYSDTLAIIITAQ